jgi:hypothetical protein
VPTGVCSLRPLSPTRQEATATSPLLYALRLLKHLLDLPKILGNLLRGYGFFSASISALIFLHVERTKTMTINLAEMVKKSLSEIPLVQMISFVLYYL